MAKKKTYEQLVAECRALQTKGRQAEAAYFLHLMKVEGEFSDVWRGAGCSDFSQFLHSNYLAQARRYNAFVLGVQRSNAASVRSFGVHWTIVLGRVISPSTEFLERFTDRARHFVQMQKTVPPDNMVDAWRRELIPIQRRRNGSDEEAQLREEVRRLTAENAALRTERDALKSELSTLKKACKKSDIKRHKKGDHTATA